MKFAVYAAALLPLVGALQSDYLSALSPATTQSQAPAGGKAFVPGGAAFFPQGSSTSNPPPPPPAPPAPATAQGGGVGYRPGGRIFYPDPANSPSNPLATKHYDHYPGSGAVPDCTRPPQVSTLNKGTYERLNGGPGEGYLLPDPANTPSNPLSSVKYDHYPGSGALPDCTKPPQVSTLNKGTYERLNGGPGEGYLLPDPANTPSNPLSSAKYDHYPGSGAVPDCTTPPSVSTLNKGTYEHLNGYQNPVSINTQNPFSGGF